MCGPSAILPVDTCRESMTSLHRSSKFSSLRILVCHILPFVLLATSFNSDHLDSDPENFDPSVLPKDTLDAIEADSFWCLSRLLDGIQDNYIFAQPGIVRSVKRMAELVARIDGEYSTPTIIVSFSDRAAPLHAHLTSQNVEFMQFAFRWMNCLLMREISVQNTIRMWDTYLVRFLRFACAFIVDQSLICRRKAPMHFLSFTYMSVRHFLYDGVRSCDRWISRSVFHFLFDFSFTY